MMLQTPITAFPNFPRLGGHLVFDLTNTLEMVHRPGHELEFFASYRHVLAWALQMDILTPAAAEARERAALVNTEGAERALETIRGIRSGIYKLFVPLTSDNTPAPDRVAWLNTWLAQIAPYRQLERQGDDFLWRWVLPTDDLVAPVYPVLYAAAEMLASPLAERLGQCPGCGWLFVDTSRNGKRRWCSMEYCGGKAKSRRQYERKKSAALS